MFWVCGFGKYREVIRWAMHKMEIEEWLTSAIMSVYIGANTFV